MAKQLLVVDDDPGLLLAVSETMRAEGYEVETARRGSRSNDPRCRITSRSDHQ